MKTNKIEIVRDWPLYMETKAQLVRALVDVPCGSGCSIFTYGVLNKTLDLLPKNTRALAHKAVAAYKECQNTFDENTLEVKDRDEKISKLAKSLMRLKKSQLWEFIGFLLEDIEC